MTILLITGLILTMTLGFSLSGLVVMTKLKTQNRLLKSVTFLLLGNAFSVIAAAVLIFRVWPAGI